MPKYIHIVVMDADYEGYSFPEAAFHDEAKADRLAAKLNKRLKSKSCRYEVLSVEVKDEQVPNVDSAAEE